MIGDRLIPEEEWDELAYYADDGRLIGYDCPESIVGDCPHTFPAERDAVMQHLETHHNINPRDGVQMAHVCGWCGWGDIDRSVVQRHVRDEHPELFEPGDAEWHPWEDGEQ
jgi:hypothetical protein